MDKILEGWANKGLITFTQITNKQTVVAYENIASDFDLDKKHFFKYLQVRSYIKEHLVKETENELIKFLIENRFKCKGKLSKIYEILQKSTCVKTEVKEKWEKELKIDISIESWRESLKGNTRITQSKYWDEFSWKVQQRFFITPDKCSKTQTLGTSCWRNCGEQRANYTHIFFLCPGLEIFWKEFGKAVKYIFDLKSLTL